MWDETVSRIKERLQGDKVTKKMLSYLQKDPRKGVQQAVATYIRNQEREKQEQQRLHGMWQFEEECRKNGYRVIAGVDEAGRGPLAGPVVAAAVILPLDFDVTDLNDSKKLQASKRDALRLRIEQGALSIGIGMILADEIDRCNILQATYRAMKMAISQLSPRPDMLLVDAVKIPKMTMDQQGIVKGDMLSHSIAAASIIAKTTRDAWMKQAAEKYPQYGFDQHMGYGTPTHLAALMRWGPTPIHRRSFAPVRRIIEKEREEVEL